MKRNTWDRRKMKKARWKRTIARARKRGELIYGGFLKFNGEIVGYKIDWKEEGNQNGSVQL